MDMERSQFILLWLATNVIAATLTAGAILAFYQSGSILSSSPDDGNRILRGAFSRAMQATCCACGANVGIPRFSCPAANKSDDFVAAGRVELVKSARLCTLVEITSKGSLKPIGRSYLNFDWEASAGEYRTLQYFCSGTYCIVELPTLAEGGHYQITTFENPSYTVRDEVARFLEQATFGPTLGEIDNIFTTDLQLSFAYWIQVQMIISPTSHREYFRRRVNSRFEVASSVGPVTHPCQKFTRYRRFAFSKKDEEQILTVETVGAMKVLRIDGFVRTVVTGPIASIDGRAIFQDGRYIFCGYPPIDQIGGSFSLEHPGQGCVPIAFNGQVGNPIVNFSAGIVPNILITITSNQARPIDQVYFPPDSNVQELLVTSHLQDPKCASIGETGNPINPVFATYNNQYWIHDPRFELLENTLQSPLRDGGGKVVIETQNFGSPDIKSARCANVARTFLNEDTCFLTSDENTCDPGSEVIGLNAPELFIPIDQTMIRAVYEESSKVAGGATYVYAVDGLRVQDDKTVSPPCARNSVSRWIVADCALATVAVNPFTEQVFVNLINAANSTSPNPFLVDVLFPARGDACLDADIGKGGFFVRDNIGTCWLNVHPDHLNVYDFTTWTKNHPGGPTPIKQFAERGDAKIVFPSWHEHDRWQNNKADFPEIGRLGDSINYFIIPEKWRTSAFNAAVGVDPSTLGTRGNTPLTFSGMLVCGSPNEVANDPSLGGNAGQGAFDPYTRFATTWMTTEYHKQKRNIWTTVSIEAEDQLRQRVAWALSQILVVSTNSISNGKTRTESFLSYYDIFVRNAFGNYRDVLKEVSFHPLMAEMLTYRRGQSTAFAYEKRGNIEYPDENYSREVMQLFTTGLEKLRSDGSPIVGEDGNPVQVYTNDDIREYSRAWTGFKGQWGRGNIETEGNVNRIDPMQIDELWRDRFPKMGLDRRYIGDGIPLCADLPKRHFLRSGAKFRLLGQTPMPELQRDPSQWLQDKAALRLSLRAGGALFEALCGSSNPSNCNYEALVVLKEDITCTASQAECLVNSVRTVEVANNVWYEYVPPTCVYQAFYDQPMMVASRKQSDQVICADPRTEVASIACCPQNTVSFWGDRFWGERASYTAASERCTQRLCTRTVRPSCNRSTPSIGYICEDNNYYWTSIGCKLRAKIDADGNVAIIHSPGDADAPFLAKQVQEDTKTFFRVDWNNPDAAKNLYAKCEFASSCSITNDGGCACDVTVSEEQVYQRFEGIPSKESILSTLHIGAFEVSARELTFSNIYGDVTVYSPTESLSSGSVFALLDDAGVRQLRMNKRSIVTVVGQNLSFRNPVHFLSLEDEEPRQAYDETDTTIDHYFYHQNVGPFLAIRLAQRFGVSNPTPNFIERIVTAFRTGKYIFDEFSQSTVMFGSGSYGDLAATVASILLDRETRSTVLDHDPSHGALKEPLIKIIGILRALDFRLNGNVPFVDFNLNVDTRVGQMAHEVPTVFSFFLPEHKPPGPLAQASLVGPEAQVSTGPRMIGLLNGLMSLIKYGLDPCYGGFGTQTGDDPWDCGRFSMGDFSRSAGRLAYTPSLGASPSSIVNELALIMTSGRLSALNRQTVARIFDDERNASLALIKAQQLIVTAPEFHSTSLVRQIGVPRDTVVAPPPLSKPYKAVVYILLSGGADSFNLLVPDTCTATNAAGETVRQQYDNVRGILGLKAEERTRKIDASGQPCTKFAIHPDLEIVEKLYKEGDLAFFANLGTINVPVTKENYDILTKSQLFAHNTMQEEVRKIDPYDTNLGTGILGRMCDKLVKKGLRAKPVAIDQATSATTGVPGEGPEQLDVASGGGSNFNPRPASEAFNPEPYLQEMNSATYLQSSLYGETWSARISKSLSDSKVVSDSFSGVQLTQSFTPKFESTQFTNTMNAAAKIVLSHGKRGTERDAIFADLGGWDHHEMLKPQLSQKFRELNEALTYFSEEMKAQGIWNDVTIVVTSDFGRTLTTNSGQGSDHGWAGNYFIMGGSVKGGQIYGQYPNDISESSDINVGRGRLIPTLSWESMLTSVVEWMGANEVAELDYIFPNRHRTGTKVYAMSEVFA